MPVRVRPEAPFINNSMKLFTNGCSFTWGAEIWSEELNFIGIPEKVPYNLNQFREEKVYSGILHQKLNTSELHNLSYGGASNQRIVRTTLEFFINHINKGLPVDDFLAVIQWTRPERFEVYDTASGCYVSMLPNCSVPGLPPDRFKFLQNRFFENPINYLDNFNISCVTLSSFFDLHKIKYVFCTIDVHTTPSEGYYKQNIKWLGDSPKLNALSELVTNHTYPQLHPNLDGHRIIAEKLYIRLKELYNL